MPTIQKRNGSYRIKVSCGYDINGKQLTKSMTWKPPQSMTPKQIEKELNRQAIFFEEKVKSGIYVDGSIKFADFAEKWLNEYGGEHLRPTTYKRYTECLKRINLAIGHIRLDRLQPQHIAAFYKNLAEDGIREDIKFRCDVDIKALLKEKKLTQAKLSELANVSICAVRATTKNQNVSKHTAEAVSAALSMPVNTLFVQADNKKTLASSTILYHHSVISTILSTAVQWQVILSNPCERVKPPKQQHNEAKYLDDIQVIELLNVLDNEPLKYKTLITLILYTGIRRGEACGLTWGDIDFTNNRIGINKSSLYLPDKGIFEDETKNKTSCRRISVPAPAMEILKQYKAEQAKQRLALGDKWVKSDKIFTSSDGKPIHPDTVSSWFHKFIERHDLPDINIHGLRHTNATLMIANGTDIKTVSNRLGHANVSTTGNIYAHAIRSADEQAAQALTGIFSKEKRA